MYSDQDSLSKRSCSETTDSVAENSPNVQCVCLVAQSRPALCDPINCNPPGSSIHVDSSEKNTGVGCHALFPGIFSTQGSNQGLLHCRQILYQLNYQGSPVYQCGCVKISKQIKHTLISERRNQSKTGQDTVFSHLGLRVP